MSMEAMKESIIHWLDELEERRLDLVYRFVLNLRG